MRQIRRGTKTGSGEISGWIVRHLRASPATVREIHADGHFTMRQIGNTIDRMKTAGAIVLHRERVAGQRRQYRLSGGETHTGKVVYPAGGGRRQKIRELAVRPSNNPDRDLEIAFRAIALCARSE